MMQTARLRALMAVGLALSLALGSCADDSGGDDTTTEADTGRLDALDAEIAALGEALEEAAGDRADLRATLDELQAKETIRGILLAFTAAVGSADVASLEALLPSVADDATLTAIEFGPNPETLVFEGHDGLLTGFGPIMEEAQANLLASAIDVTIDGDEATARFKFANSVVPPVVINDQIDVKVLLFAANTATLRHEGDAWLLTSFELVHSLAYPGSLEAVLRTVTGG